jgi:hypothetical protein
MAGNLFNVLDRKVGDVKTWELYVGFVLLQILIGVLVYLVVAVFDLAGINGTLGAIVRQLGLVLQAQNPQKWATPIMAEVKEGKLF